ncbi:class I SAM-dependent methyltransferase [Bacillus sp. ISL-47]|uniref:class I SAM-dependent methyltransferase n=1 Tax=Bacillus sp. ISL-47 TaxID=2819130 RepID=UPI001BE7BF3C|nr:class I SAM-dependent methyltransferase [Bacillus sp. ISL-47]MBT2688470.1 class I SAM-dependent methyltransferase [Bacillus sp. ISL-47]
MIKEYVRLLKARNWMKKNQPFLYSWHAYVGFELDLFSQFRKWSTVKEVASSRNLQEELLLRWVEVGLAIRHLKKKGKDKIKTASKFSLPSTPDNPRSTGIILKEMMELHIPTLLSYPELLRSNKRNIFNHEEHGQTVARTSSLLEQLALPRLLKTIRKNKIRRIIDIGCGEGGYLTRISQKFPAADLTGIEMNEEVAESAQNNCRDYQNIHIIASDVYDYTPEYEADLIMINNLLHYIEPQDRKQLLSRLKSWLSRSGSITIITPILHPKKGEAFSSVFNSFFSAFENLYPTPTEEDIGHMAKELNLKVKTFKPVVTEGGWYFIQLSNK